MAGQRGTRGGRRSNPDKKEVQAGRYRVLVLHAVDPDANLRLQRALEILLGAGSCSEEVAPDQQMDVQEDQGSELAEDGDVG